MPTATNMTPVEPQFVDRRKYDALRDKCMADIAAIFARSDCASVPTEESVIKDGAVSFEPVTAAQPVFKAYDSREHVPIHLKMALTIKEAAEYSNIGINRLDSMLRTPNCPFVLFVGTKKLVKRQEFEQFIRTALVI